MDTNFYDVVVCGPDLGGVVAAALLGRRGFRVLLVGHDGDRPAFEAGGIALSRGPALLPPLDSLPVARILKELNSVQIVRRRAPVLSPALQIVMPRHRFDVTADAAALRRELDREFPAERAAIEAAIERLGAASAQLDPLLESEVNLPPEGFWERREVARVESLLPATRDDLLAPLPADHPVRAAFAAPALLSTALAPSDVGAVTQARAFDLARRGQHLMDGGFAALYGVFLEKIETFSGERRDKVLPVEIVLRRGRAAGLRVRPRDETIGCQYLIWAGPTDAMVRLCGDKPSRRMRESAASLRPGCFVYLLALVADAGAIPDGMGPRLILIGDPAKPLLEENALAITIGAASPRDPGRVPIWVECLVPAPAVDPGRVYLRGLRAKVRTQLRTLLPFLDQALAVVASPHDGLPAEGSAVPESAASRPLPVCPLPAAYSSELPRSLDVGGLGHATGIKNLYLLGRENLPGLGLEGELIAAWSVARQITAGQPKRDVLRRTVIIGES